MDDQRTRKDSKACDLSVVKNLRRKWGLSADELAEKAGLTRGTVLKIEAGAGNPTLQTIEALARVLHVSPSELVGLAESRTAETGRCETFDREGYQGTRVRYADLELYHLCVRAGVQTCFDPDLHENTWEVCFVSKGLVRIEVGGRSHELQAGDSLRFKALHEHRMDVLEDAELFLVHYNLI